MIASPLMQWASKPESAVELRGTLAGVHDAIGEHLIFGSEGQTSTDVLRSVRDTIAETLRAYPVPEPRDPAPEPEDDGQPDEQQEWSDFDADC